MKNKVIVYVHGANGSANEKSFFEYLSSEYDVIGFDYKSEFPWEAAKEFVSFFRELKSRYESVNLIANSIGAFFSMISLKNENIDKTVLISPVVDMEKLISQMMENARITPRELASKGEIRTESGQTLSWRYYMFAKEFPLVWNKPTLIVYGDKDNITSYQTISEFAMKSRAKLKIMKEGEHWFHTQEQMQFLLQQIKEFF